MKAAEAKVEDQLTKIRFDTTVKLNEKGRKVAQKQLYMRISELVMGKMQGLLAQAVQAHYDAQDECFRFPRFEFKSD